MYYVYYTQNNLEPTKCYVGMTKHPITSTYMGSGIYIDNAVKKYSKSNFTRVDLGEFKDKAEAHYWEGFYIKTLKTLVTEGGYNLSPTGGITGGGIVSDETRKKISQNTKIAMQDSEIRKKCGKGKQGNCFFKGKKHSEKTKIELSNIRKGKKHSEETKNKISIASKGNKAMLGKKHSLETREKLSLKRQGRKPMLGKKHSDETKRKMSESLKIASIKGWETRRKNNILYERTS